MIFRFQHLNQQLEARLRLCFFIESYRRTIFPFWLNFHQDLGLSHYFDDFADIASGLVEQLQFLSQQSN
jgi:hypothetical protein